MLSEVNKENERGKGLETEKATALQTGREDSECCTAEKEGRPRERKKWGRRMGKASRSGAGGLVPSRWGSGGGVCMLFIDEG